MYTALLSIKTNIDRFNGARVNHRPVIQNANRGTKKPISQNTSDCVAGGRSE